MSRRNYYDYDDYDGYCGDPEYAAIAMNSDPKLVKDTSMLRHYINCHGVTGKLLKYFGVTESELEDIVCNTGGMESLGYLRSHHDEYMSNLRENIESRQRAERKNEELIEQIFDLKNTLCGIGIRKTKLLLNKYADAGDMTAKALRMALEAEYQNIKAKETYYYRDRIYEKKERCLSSLMDICKEAGFVYGRQDSDNYSAKNILYFELPGCRQISFHCADNSMCANAPEYKGEWDGEINSTLPKLDEAIRKFFDKTPIPVKKKDKFDLEIFIHARRISNNNLAAVGHQTKKGTKKSEAVLTTYERPENDFPEIYMLVEMMTGVADGSNIRVHLTSGYLVFLLKGGRPRTAYVPDVVWNFIDDIKKRKINIKCVKHEESSGLMKDCVDVAKDVVLKKLDNEKN